MEKQQTDNTPTIENALKQLNESLLSQQEKNHALSQRMARMNLFIILFVLLMTSGMGYLVWTLKEDMDDMNAYMHSIEKDASTMSNAAVSMEASMSSMERDISNLVGHTESMSKAMLTEDNSPVYLAKIAKSVALMQEDISGLNHNIYSMSTGVNTINKHMKSLNKKLGIMTQDVNRMSSPVRMFPF
jgi:predicted  nucleic acid-binding Zn-ribbon protein